MAHKEFIDYLYQVLATITQYSKFTSGPEYPELEFPEEIRSKVEQLLRLIPELKNLEQKTLRRISGGGSIRFFRVAISILERLSLGDKPEKIYEDLIDFVTRKKLPNFYLAGISGISLSKKLELTEKITIISPDDISPNMVREFVFRIDRFGKILGASHEPLRPQAALMIASDQQVLFQNDDPIPEQYGLSSDTIREIEKKILFCITLASENAAPVFTAKTSWIDHPTSSYHGLTGGSGGTSPGMQQTSRYDDFDVELTHELFSLINGIHEQDQRLLFLATERLRRSRLHEEPVNRALDLGVALEIIFLSKAGNNQELSYRAAMHAAFFLGVELEERISIRDVVRLAYTARSKAVHTGQLKDEKYISILPKADKLCRESIIKLIKNGGFPENWESVIFAT